MKATRLGATGRWEGVTLGQRGSHTAGVGQAAKAGSTGMENKDGYRGPVRMTAQWLKGSESL